MNFYFNVAQHTLYDIRDNKPYTVRKLADGNCWMTDNLAFELQANQTYIGVDNTTGQEISFNTGAACSTNGACIMNGNTAYNSSSGQWYYSWYAATAGSGTSNQANTDAQYSICPTGWRLPPNYTISTTKSYGSLTNAYGFTTNGENNSQNHVTQLESDPLNFARSGHYNGGSLNGNDINGIYYPSTAYTGATNAYYFIYNAPSTYPQSYGAKYDGFNVRCVAL